MNFLSLKIRHQIFCTRPNTFARSVSFETKPFFFVFLALTEENASERRSRDKRSSQTIFHEHVHIRRPLNTFNVYHPTFYIDPGRWYNAPIETAFPSSFFHRQKLTASYKRGWWVTSSFAASSKTLDAARESLSRERCREEDASKHFERENFVIYNYLNISNHLSANSSENYIHREYI